MTFRHSSMLHSYKTCPFRIYNKQFLVKCSWSFWATVCKTVCPMLSDRCLSVCLSVRLSVLFLLRSNGCMDQDVTWYGAKPRPRRLCVRWEPSPLLQKGAEPPSPIVGPFLLWPNGWMHQDATWYGGRPHHSGLCVRWRPSPPNFRPMFIVAKRLDGSRCHLARR